MNIYQRINEVRKKVDYVQKDANVDNRYKAVSHDAVTAAIRKHLIEQGIVMVPRVITSSVVATGQMTSKNVPYIRYEGRYEVDFVNCDDPTDKLTIPVDAHGIDSGDKAPGKALSVATKSAILKVFSLETGEDDESRANGHGEEESQVPQVISKEQVKELQGMLDAAGVSARDFCVAGQCNSVPELLADNFEGAKKWLIRKSAKKPVAA